MIAAPNLIGAIPLKFEPFGQINSYFVAPRWLQRNSERQAAVVQRIADVWYRFVVAFCRKGELVVAGPTLAATVHKRQWCISNIGDAEGDYNRLADGVILFCEKLYQHSMAR